MSKMMNSYLVVLNPFTLSIFCSLLSSDICFSAGSQKKSSYASGSWNIHEEIRKVRSKATEDMLRAHPSKETDYQLRLVERKAEPKSAVGDLTGTSTAERINDSSSLRLAKLSDVPIKWSGVLCSNLAS